MTRCVQQVAHMDWGPNHVNWKKGGWGKAREAAKKSSVKDKDALAKALAKIEKMEASQAEIEKEKGPKSSPERLKKTEVIDVTP